MTSRLREDHIEGRREARWWFDVHPETSAKEVLSFFRLLFAEDAVSRTGSSSLQPLAALRPQRASVAGQLQTVQQLRAIEKKGKNIAT